MTNLKSIKQLQDDLQRALNADAIRDYNMFGNPHSVYRPYIIISLHPHTSMGTKQKLVEYIYTSYENIHFVELVNQNTCICVDYERDCQDEQHR
jgi:hypothetical protein